VRLWVDGHLIINNWREQGATESAASITLVAGQKYDIRMEYYEHNMSAVAQLSWSSASTPKQIIPQSQLYSSSALTSGSASVFASTAGAPGHLESQVSPAASPVVTPPALDVVAPTVTVRTPVHNATYRWLESASGRARDVGGSRVQAVYGSLMRYSDNYYWNGTEWTPQAASVLCKGKTVWQMAFPELADGHYAFTAAAQDGAGNTGLSATVDFSIAAP
jgi:hypothetical protein